MKKQNKISNRVKIEINNLTKEKIDLRLARKVISAFGRAYQIHPVKSPLKRGARPVKYATHPEGISRGKQFNGVNKNQEISLAFVGDAEIKKLNKIYRGLSQATDILSFAGEGYYLGEIIIDYGQIKRQAGRFKQSVRQELIFILTHGLLHLIGYDDKTEKGRLKMIKLGEKFIKNYL